MYLAKITLVLLFLTQIASADIKDSPDGSLLFLENSHRWVKRYTESSYTHVAILIRDKSGKPWVYDADQPKISKVPFKEWMTTVGDMRNRSRYPILVSVLKPKTPYSDKELSKMRIYLEEQKGRRYSVLGYLQGSPVNGIHCSEMCASAIEKTGRILFYKNGSSFNCVLSPGDLRKMVKPIYEPMGKKVKIKNGILSKLLPLNP